MEMIVTQTAPTTSAANLSCLLWQSEDWTPIPHSRAMAKLMIMPLYDSQGGAGV